MALSPVDFDPFAEKIAPPGYTPSEIEASRTKPKLTPVEGNPFDPEQMTGVAREVALPASNVAKGAVTALGMPGDLIGQLTKLYSTTIGGPTASALTGTKVEPWSGRNPIDSTSLLSGTKAMGLTDRPDLTPQNTRERYEAAGAEGAGAILPALVIPGAAARGVSGLGRMLTQGVGAGIGAKGASDAVEANEWLRDSRPAKLISPLVGALLGGGLGSGVYGAGEKAVRAVGPGFSANPVVAAYDRLRIDPALAGDVTGTPALRSIQAYAAKAPGAEGRIERTSERVVGQFGDAAERAADSLGPARTLVDAGTTLQTRGKKWMDDFRQSQAADWGDVDRYVPGPTQVALPNFTGALGNIARDFPGAPTMGKTLQGALPKRMADAVAVDAPTGTYPWQTVKNIRTRIGEMLSDPNLPADTNIADLKRIYAGLSSDMEAAVAAAGPQAQAAFQKAVANTRGGHEYIDGVLKPVLKQGQTPETAAQAVLSASGRGGTSLEALRREMPEAADDLAAYTLREMALATPGRQNATGTLASPATFLTDLNKMSPEARAALFQNPGVRQAVEDLAAVGGTMKETAARLNTSNTGRFGALASILMGAPAGAVAGGHVGGAAGAALGAVGAPGTILGGNWLAGRASSSPTMTRILAEPSSAPASSLARALSLQAAYPQVRQDR